MSSRFLRILKHKTLAPPLCRSFRWDHLQRGYIFFFPPDEFFISLSWMFCFVETAIRYQNRSGEFISISIRTTYNRRCFSLIHENEGDAALITKQRIYLPFFFHLSKLWDQFKVRKLLSCEPPAPMSHKMKRKKVTKLRDRGDERNKYGEREKKKTFSHFLNARAEGEVVLFCSQSKLRWRSAPSELLVTPTDNFRNYLPPLRPGGCVWQFNWQSDILTHVAPWAASGALLLSLLTQLFFITFRGKKTECHTMNGTAWKCVLLYPNLNDYHRLGPIYQPAPPHSVWAVSVSVSADLQ